MIIWRAVAAGALLGTAISIALGMTFWPGLMFASVAFFIDSRKK